MTKKKADHEWALELSEFLEETQGDAEKHNNLAARVQID